MAKPFPLPDPDTEHFWKAAAEGRLDIQRCKSCSRHIFYPRAICPYCGALGPEWVTAVGSGEVYSYTVVHRAPPEFADEAPYVIALVDLDEGVRMMTRLVDVDPKEVRVGLRVQVVFAGEPPAPHFRPSP